MEQDHIISEIRKNREKLSEQFNNDLDKLFNHFKKKKIQIKAQEFSAEEEIRFCTVNWCYNHKFLQTGSRWLLDY